MSLQYKRCSQCKIEQSIDNFYYRKDTGKYRGKCKSCWILSCKKYATDNKAVEVKRKEYRYDHKEEKRNYDKTYNKNKSNKEKRKIREAHRNKGIGYRLKCNLRKRLSKAIRRNQKAGSAIRDLGCTIEELKAYLASQFKDGMTWENYGEWHIDHIKPLSAFDLSDIKQLKEVCHYSNLQPLWAKDNISKGAKLK